MIPIIAATAIGGIIVYLLTHSGGILDQITTGGASTGATGNSQQSIQIGAQGTSPYSPGGSKVGYGLQSAGLANAGAGLFTTSIAVPIIGFAVAAGAAIWGIMQKHHAEAVAKEAAVLNTAAPHFRNGLVQLCAAALNGEILDDSTFGKFLDQLIDDYYTEVKSIIRGKWPANAGDKPPDPCNGACVVGHWWIEKDSQQLRGLVSKVKAKQHGSFNLPAIPAHAGFQGSPSITINY